MEEVCDLNRCVVAALAASVRRRESEEELRCLMIASTNYMRTLEQWRDPKSGLNLLQLAVVAGNPHAVRLLYAAYPCLLKTEQEPVLHMACYLGQEAIARYLVETANCDIHQIATLDCQRLKDLYDSMKVLQRTTLTGKPMDNSEPIDIFAKQAKGPVDSPPSQGADQLHIDIDCELPVCDNCNCSNDGETVLTGTPYIFSVVSMDVECANYMLEREFQVRGVRPAFLLRVEWSALQLAAYMGCPRHLALMLRCPQYRSSLTRSGKNGLSALHLALVSGNAGCLQVLLKSGVSLQLSSHRNALHYLCSESVSPCALLACTQVILKHMDTPEVLHHQDENGNTALGYLAWSIARLAGVSMNATPVYPACHTNSVTEVQTDKEESEGLVLACMENLLNAGSSTLVPDLDGAPDHNLLVTVLQSKAVYHGRALHSHPELLYRACSLLFQYGADANVSCRHQQHSAFITLLLHAFHDLPSSHWRRRYLDLFLLNGADLDYLVAAPSYRLENQVVRRWDIYPVMIALEERHPLLLVRIFYDFMAMRHVYHSLRLMRRYHMWHAMTWTLTDRDEHQSYRRQWQELCRPQVRTLRHVSKLVIFKQLGRKGQSAAQLPLPFALKQYVNSTDF